MRRIIIYIALAIMSLFVSGTLSAQMTIVQIDAADNGNPDTEEPENDVPQAMSERSGIVAVSFREGGKNVNIKIGPYEFRVSNNKKQAADTLLTAIPDADSTGMDNIMPGAVTDKPETTKHRRYTSNSTIGIIEFGFNLLPSVDYSMYPDRTEDFMDLRVLASHQIMFGIPLGVQLTKGGGVQLSTGLQFGWNNYVLDNRAQIIRDNGNINYYHPDDYVRKSKITTFSLQIPVIFDFRIADDFFISAGAYGGVNLSSVSKIKFPVTRIRDPYLTPVYGGVTVRITVESVYLYCNYNLTEFFRAQKGPDANSMTIGIGFTL